MSTFLRIHKGDPPIETEGTGKVRGSQRKHSLSQQCFRKVLHVTLTLLIPSAFVNHWSGLVFFGGGAGKRGTKAQKDIVIRIKNCNLASGKLDREPSILVSNMSILYSVID